MKHGKTHVQILLGIRVRDIVEQVTLQLKFKSANRSFPVTKQALNQISQQLLAAWKTYKTWYHTQYDIIIDDII